MDLRAVDRFKFCLRNIHYFLDMGSICTSIGVAHTFPLYSSLKKGIRRGLIGLLDGSRSPLAPGDLVRAGIRRRIRSRGKMQGHRCRGDRRPGGNGGHGGELDVRPGQARGAVADVQAVQALVLSPPRGTGAGMIMVILPRRS